MNASIARFFISYAHVDKTLASRLRNCIKQEGFECFMDRYDIEPGQAIDLRIMRAMEGCTHLLILHSPASDKSFWVHYELGAASALKRSVIEFLTHQSQSTFPPLHLTKHITTVSELKSYLRQLRGMNRATSGSSLDPVLERAKNALYHTELTTIRAIRVFGADAEFVPASRVRVKYRANPYIRPVVLQARAEAYCASKERKCRESNIDFFDGPAAQLLRWQAGTRDARMTAAEPTELRLELGPVSWYDYEGCNAALAEDAASNQSFEFLNGLIGITSVVDSGDVSRNTLPNILDTAVTLVSKDEYVAYTTRGHQVTFSGRLTSAVAENVNRYLDDTHGGNPTKLVHSRLARYRSKSRKDRNYEPVGIPHPLAAAIRGVEEELSPDLLRFVDASNLKVTGICFDLNVFHPTLLICLAVPLTAEQIEGMCRRRPGKDHRKEVRLSFVPASEDHPETKELLARDTWLPGGQASLFRALELLAALKRDLSFQESFEILSR